MLKVAKYKILTLIDDKLFKFIVVAFFIILNYEVFLNSGMLSDGSENFNQLLKYTLLINNFTITTTVFGLLIAIYVGSGLIGNDISSGKLYIMLTSFPKRWKYLLGNLLGLTIIIVALILLILFNYFVATTVLNVIINVPDLIECFIFMLINMLVIMSATAVTSIFLPGKTSLIVGIIELSIFNIYTFQSIPFLNYGLNININIRRILACFAPITNVSPPSIYSDGNLSRYIVEPIIIGNMVEYQVLFITVILILGIVTFKHKEL